MAMERIGGGMWLPVQPFFNSAIPEFFPGGRICDASGEKIAFVFRCPKSGTLDKAEVRLAATTQTVTNGIKISFQDVDPADGTPDETVDQFRVVTPPGSGGWMVPGLMTSDGTDGGVKRTVTRGDYLCVVLEFQSFSAGNDFTMGFLNIIAPQLPYSVHKVGGVWTKYREPFAIGLKYTDGSYPYILGGGYPTATLGVTNFDSTSTPDEVGLTFSFLSDVLVGGASARLDFVPGSCDMRLYDSQNNVLATASLDKDIIATTDMAYYPVFFAQDVLCRANETYRLTIRPTTGAMDLAWYTVNATGMLDEMEGGASWVYTSRVNDGGWTEDPVKRPWMSVLVTGIDHEVGGQPSQGFAGVP